MVNMGPREVTIDSGPLFLFLNNRFGSRSAGAALPAFDQTIVPTYDVRYLYEEPKAQSVTLDLSGTGGYYAAAVTVPNGFRWYVSYIHRGTTTAQSVVRADIDGVAIVQLGDTRGTDHAQFFPPQLVLDGGDSLGLQTTGNAADTGTRFEVLYIEEQEF
jgi:hypothetical protein